MKRPPWYAFALLIQAEFIHQVVAGILQFAHHVGDDLQHLVGLLAHGGFPFSNGAQPCFQLLHGRSVLIGFAAKHAAAHHQAPVSNTQFAVGLIKFFPFKHLRMGLSLIHI